MNVLSTFSGVGGMDLGLARAGWRHVGLCERDEYRRAVLAERFPGVPRWHDVRDVGLKYPDHDPYGRAWVVPIHAVPDAPATRVEQTQRSLALALTALAGDETRRAAS